MKIDASDLVMPMVTSEGKIVAYKVLSPGKAEDLMIPMVASGAPVGMRMVSMTKEDDLGLPGISVEGKVVALKSIDPLGMLLIFIDESSPYTEDPATWVADVIRWNTLVEEYGPPEAIVCNVPGGAPGDVMGGAPPEDLIVQGVSRSPSLQEFIDIYNDAKGGENRSDPEEVVLLVDNSGSMTRSTIEPGITQFEEWLDDPDEHGGEAVPRRYVSFSDERWLSWTADWYEEYRQEE